MICAAPQHTLAPAHIRIEHRAQRSIKTISAGRTLHNIVHTLWSTSSVKGALLCKSGAASLWRETLWRCICAGYCHGLLCKATRLRASYQIDLGPRLHEHAVDEWRRARAKVTILRVAACMERERRACDVYIVHCRVLGLSVLICVLSLIVRYSAKAGTHRSLAAYNAPQSDAEQWPESSIDMVRPDTDHSTSSTTKLSGLVYCWLPYASCSCISAHTFIKHSLILVHLISCSSFCMCSLFHCYWMAATQMPMSCS